MTRRPFIVHVASVSAVLALAACAQPVRQQEQAPLIAMEDFFRNPEQTAFELSPGGVHVAFLAPWHSRLNVHVKTIGTDDSVRITGATERDIASFAWAGDHRIVYFQDTGGDENYHAYGVDVDGSELVELTPFDGVKAILVDELEDDEQHMLISLNRRDERLFDVYRVNVRSGELEMIAENPGDIEDWLTDTAGQLRVAVAFDGVNTSLLYRESEADAFENVLTTSFKDAFEPLFFSFDDRSLYVSSNLGRNTRAIFMVDPASAQQIELVYEHPEVDVNSLLRSKARKLITGVSFTTDKRGYQFFDEQRRQLQESLEAKLPGTEVTVSGFSRDERRALVRTYSDTSQGAYYFHDLDTGELSKLVDVSPWLDESQMANMEPIAFTARDGLTIHGYLTLPRGVDPAGLPAVVVVHGGPWARDRWGFDPEAQFLANRGYAVLQVNFRGSTGYGKAFWQASFKQWGRTMQDDVSDGVQWLVDKGIADPERVGIYGASYGGYAVLAGLAFTPDLYACGVDYVGISNLFTVLASIPPYWELRRQMFYEMMGNPETEAELLRAASPLFHADRIRAPLMVLQGANDIRCTKSEADQIVRALAERGIDVPYMVKENEGHGFRNEENRFDVYRAMEHFLGRHLGGRVEPDTVMPEMNGTVDLPPQPADEIV